jgi:hypothetical protein
MFDSLGSRGLVMGAQGDGGAASSKAKTGLTRHSRM